MGEVNGRPCRYCVAFYTQSGQHPTILPEPWECEFEHRDEPRVYALARAMAKVMQDRHPSDEQIAWFLGDANDMVDDFDPTPERWRVRKLPESRSDYERQIEVRLRINDVTYVGLQGGKDTRGQIVRLSKFREWEREASRA